jgi:hypothetical protein
MSFSVHDFDHQSGARNTQLDPQKHERYNRPPLVDRKSSYYKNAGEQMINVQGTVTKSEALL